MATAYISVYPYQKKSKTQPYVFDAAVRFCDAFNLPYPSKMIKGGKGKPYFSGREDLFFSLSHSGNLLVVGVSAVVVGVDLQQHRKANCSAIARRFFHPDETAFLEQNLSCFFDVWAAKESYVKYTGEGITSSFSSFSTIKDNSFRNKIDDAFLQILSVRPGFSLALTSKEAVETVLFEPKGLGINEN